MAERDTPQDIPAIDAKQGDLSQYIRTYAKDVAALTGTAAPAANLPKKDVEEAGVTGVALTKEQEEQSFVAPPTAAQRLYEESTVIPSASELGGVIDEKAVASTSAALGSLMPQAASQEADREAVLARLRKKLSERSEMAIETPRPEPVPEPLPPPPPAPTFEPPFETSLPVAPMPPVSRTPSDNSVPSRLHTFSSDFADRIDLKEASTFSVLAAQEDAKRGPAQPARVRSPFPVKRVATIAAGVVLIAAGGTGAYAAYHYLAQKNALAPLLPSVPSLVFADEYKELQGSGVALQQALANEATQPLVEGNVLVTYVTESTTTNKGALLTQPLPGGYLIEALQLQAPDIIFRNIEDTSTVGIIHAGSETRPFFVLAASSYERTYAGMLTWEPLMEQSLALFYPLYPAPAQAAPSVATTTVKGKTVVTQVTPAAPVQPVALTRFEDGTVSNHPVRILKDTAGNTLIVYGYADKQTLIIARNEAAFAALLPRLAAAQ